MQLNVIGKQIDVGDALRSHVEQELSGTVEKYFTNPIEATVVFSRQAHLYQADIQVHAGRNVLLQSTAEADEPYVAFDAAADKIAKRLRRHKRRLIDVHRATPAAPGLPASSYVIDAEAESPEADDNDGPDQPVVVAETETSIDELTVSEAVMRLDLGDLPALMFRNSAHGGLNMIYRRPDGHIGWVDPRGMRDTVA